MEKLLSKHQDGTSKGTNISAQIHTPDNTNPNQVGDFHSAVSSDAPRRDSGGHCAEHQSYQTLSGSHIGPRGPESASKMADLMPISQHGMALLTKAIFAAFAKFDNGAAEKHLTKENIEAMVNKQFTIENRQQPIENEKQNSAEFHNPNPQTSQQNSFSDTLKPRRVEKRSCE